MPPMVSDQLQQVLSEQQPDSVTVEITAHADRADETANRLRQQGVDFERTSVGDIVIFEGTMDTATVQTLTTFGGIRNMELSQRFHTLGHAVGHPGQTAAEPAAALGRNLADTAQDLNIKQAWDELGTRGDGVNIGVVDTAAQPDHPAYEHALVEKGDSNSPLDHGTWVAGCCCMEETDTPHGTMHGVAPDADLYTYGALTEDGGRATDIASGVEFCIENDVDVLNLSLGSPAHSSVMHDILLQAWQNGILPVVAAGNNGPQDDTMTCPGHHGSCYSVAAVNVDMNVSGFSSRGPGYGGIQKPDGAAPGGDGDVQDDGSTVATEVIYGPYTGGTYGSYLGTSMAAPHITGLAALRIAAGELGQ